MIDTMNLAKYFLSINPSLTVGNFDNNLKLNKLLYFSNLMYYSVFDNNLIDEDFERWDNGPVVREVYKAFRYNGLNSNTNCDSEEFSSDVKTIIQIVNFIYGNKTPIELSNETHTHNIWINAPKNAHLEFQKMDLSVIKYMKNLYSIYKEIDFENFHKDIINGNTYFYYDDEIDLSSEESLNEIQNIPPTEFPIFVELMNGELVFS